MQKLLVEDLHKRYGANEVLKGVSLAANAGDTVQIESGYGQESATVTHNGMTVTGLATVSGDEVEVPERT